MEGLQLSVQELSRELSAFGVDQNAVRSLKGKQMMAEILLRSYSSYLNIFMYIHC